MQALKDILVLDLGQIYNGSYCSLLLAYFGATVIKIEPPEGEPLRRRLLGFDTDREPYEFLLLNPNKLSLCLDLKAEAGKQVLLKLAEKADVLVENFKRGTMERLGLGYDVLSRINPRLIYASGKGFGLSGPYADFPAMDLTVQAMGGVMATTGFPDGPPVKAGPAVCDFMGGIHLFAGVMVALFQRVFTGRGQLVEVSMHDAIYPALASPLGALYNAVREVPERTGNRHSGLRLAPYNVYPAADGYVAIFCVSERHWEAFARHIGRPELLEDDRFKTNSARALHMDELDAIVAGWTSRRTRWEVVWGLMEAGVPCAPVLSVREVADDPHLKARGMLRDVDHPEYGPIRLMGNPIRLSDSPLEGLRPPARLGADTELVLRQYAGLSDAEIERLKQERVVF